MRTCSWNSSRPFVSKIPKGIKTNNLALPVPETAHAHLLLLHFSTTFD
jgi:hypothetical protein